MDLEKIKAYISAAQVDVEAAYWKHSQGKQEETTKHLQDVMKNVQLAIEGLEELQEEGVR